MMPKSIVLFERFAYLTIVLGLVSSVINWPLIAKRHGPAVFVLTVLIGIGIQVFLIRRTVRKRSWARWTFIALISVGTPVGIANEFVRRTPHNGVVGNAAFYLAYLAGVVAAYPAVAGDYPVFCIDQDRAHEPELLDACGNLPDLFFGVGPGIAGAGF